MNLQAKEKRSRLGLYVHVPFCASTCDFCGFYQKKPHNDDFERFVSGIEKELNTYSGSLEVDTVFWGGGTPGLLTPRDMERLGQALLGKMKAPPAEWTVEMAPAFVTRRKLEILKQIGVSRISLGVQSFRDTLLDKLGRQHTRSQVFKAIDMVQSAEFQSFNLDLIFAIPGQDQAALQEDLNEVVGVSPQHVSTYCLTFEEDTALFVKLSEGKLSIDTELEADLYLRAWDQLAEAGFEQYEVSNFSKPGFECIHNINTWCMEQWIGLGPAASSQYAGQRWSNVPDLDKWLKGIDEESPCRVEEVGLSPDILAVDSLVFGLRMNAGINLVSWESRFRTPKYLLDPLLTRWESNALIDPWSERGCLRLTREGRLVADALGGELLDYFDKESMNRPKPALETRLFS